MRRRTCSEFSVALVAVLCRLSGGDFPDTLDRLSTSFWTPTEATDLPSFTSIRRIGILARRHEIAIAVQFESRVLECSTSFENRLKSGREEFLRRPKVMNCILRACAGLSAFSGVLDKDMEMVRLMMVPMTITYMVFGFWLYVYEAWSKCNAERTGKRKRTETTDS